MPIISIACLINFILNFSASLFFAIVKPHSKLKTLWVLYTFLVSIWALGFFISTVTSNYDIALLWCRIQNHSATLIPLFFLHFIIIVLRKEHYHKKLLQYFYILNISYFFFSLLNYKDFVVNVEDKIGVPNYTEAGWMYYPFPFIFITTVLLAFILIQRHFPSLPKKIKDQINLIKIGVGIGFSSGASSFFLSFDIPIDPSYPLFLTSIYTFTFSYAVIKHQLLDIKIFIQKSILYTLLISILTIFYILLIYIAENIFQNLIGYRSIFPSLIFATLIAFIFIPLRHFLQNIIDKFIFKESYINIANSYTQFKHQAAEKEKFKAVATLASGMAHEVKNPLTAIKTFAEYLPQKLDDKEFLLKFSELVNKEVARIDQTIKDLLEFAKPSPPDFRQVNISKLIQETLDLLNSQFVEQHIEVNFQGDKHVYIQADTNQIKQALLNLSLNAIDAMPHGGMLTVKVAEHNKGHKSAFIPIIHPNAEVIISITDTGKGIPEKKMKKIFDPFYTNKDDGTGLGLSITKGIIEEHGGKIKVASTPGEGSTFTIRLNK